MDWLGAIILFGLGVLAGRRVTPERRRPLDISEAERRAARRAQAVEDLAVVIEERHRVWPPQAREWN